MIQQHRPISVTRSSSPGRGQGLLEFALFLPILLLLIGGLVEVALYAITYLTALDASREAGRFGSHLDPELTTHHPFDMRDHNGDGWPDNPFPDVRPPTMTTTSLLAICREGQTTNFYYAVACLAYQNLPEAGFGRLDPSKGDDIVITVVGVTRTATLVYRWPLRSQGSPHDHDYHFKGAQNDGRANPSCTITQIENCRCWSFFGVRSSQFDNASIVSRLRPAAPSTAFVIVEIFHKHSQLFGFFGIGDFIPNPIEMRPYAIFPVPAAEPR